MTTTFFERNKKKGALAALFLFIRERKALSVLLFLVLIASTLFVSPSHMLINLPGGPRLLAGVAWLAQKFGVDVSQWGLSPDDPSFRGLTAAFRQAKDSGSSRPVGWGPMMAPPKDPKNDSLNMVEGKTTDLESKGVDIKAGESVKGIANADEVKSSEHGVELSDEDLASAGKREGWVKNAFAGGFANGFTGSSSMGAFAGRGLLNGGRGGAGSFGNDGAKAGLDGMLVNTRDIKSKIKGASSGKMAAFMKAAVPRQMRGAASARSLKGQRAFAQLATQRGRSMLSVPPTCTIQTCPGEFAAVNTGVVYDGGRISGPSTQVLSAPQVDRIASPNIPGAGLAQNAQNEADKMVDDAEKCRKLDEEYGPREKALQQQMENTSKQFRAMNCGGGGCSKGKVNACNQMGDQMKRTCSEYQSVRCQHTKACPLTKDFNCSNECEGTGGVHGKPVNIAAGTEGNTDGSGMSTSGPSACSKAQAKWAPKKDEAKADTRGNIAKYRGSRCDDPLFLSKATAADKAVCKNLGDKIVLRCHDYVGADCEEKKACPNSPSCAPSSVCALNRLDDIEKVLDNKFAP